MNLVFSTNPKTSKLVYQHDESVHSYGLYVNNVKSGKWTYCYPSRFPRKYGFFVDGVKDGIWFYHSKYRKRIDENMTWNVTYVQGKIISETYPVGRNVHLYHRRSPSSLSKAKITQFCRKLKIFISVEIIFIMNCNVHKILRMGK